MNIFDIRPSGDHWSLYKNGRLKCSMNFAPDLVRMARGYADRARPASVRLFTVLGQIQREWGYAIEGRRERAR
jgi:hypothetical protein